MHELEAKRPKAEELARDVMEGAVPEGHQGVVPRRPDRHRGEARVVDPHGAGGERAVLVDEDGRTRIEGTEDAHAVEDVVSAAVPQVGEVEDCVDDAGGVARLAAPDVDAADVEDGVGGGRPEVGRAPWSEAREVGPEDALRGHDVVRVMEHGRGAVLGMFELVEGEIGRGELVVGPAAPGDGGVEDRPQRRIGVLEPRAQLVLAPAVSAGVEVAGRARHAVAPDLHVPEEGLAELDGGAPRERARLQEVVQVVRLGNVNVPERVEPRVEGHAPDLGGVEGR